MKFLKSNKSLIFFTLAFLLTLDGSAILLFWISQIITFFISALNLTPPSNDLFAVIGLSLQILLSIIAALFAYLSISDKNLKPFAISVIAINSVLVLNNLAMFLYAVFTNELSL